MGEVVNVIVAFAVIVILFRWVTSSQFSTSHFPFTGVTLSPHLVWPIALNIIQATNHLLNDLWLRRLVSDRKKSLRIWFVPPLAAEFYVCLAY
jgi:hypothetical protein